MKHIGYIMKRLLDMNYKAMLDMINHLHKKTGKSRLWLLWDMQRCATNYGAGYMDYNMFDMYNLTPAQRDTFLTRGRNNDFVRKYNDPSLMHIFHNKDEFNALFDKMVARDWVTTDDREGSLAFLEKHPVFMSKPYDGSGGQSVEKMRREQITDEIIAVVDLINEVYTKFGFKYTVELSTRPENSMGSDEDWEVATESLRSALDDLGLNYVVNEGDGAFYGPKIDFHLEDSIGRTWQCGTIQLDFQLPQRFEMEYVGEDGGKHRPIMVHRVAFGSIERFIGILIEHYAGAFPLWLAPEQVRVLPVSDKALGYAEKVRAALKAEGFRVDVDVAPDKLGAKIREATLQKVPFQVVVGSRDEAAGTVSVRSRADGDLGAMTIADLAKHLKEKIEAAS